MKFNTCIEDSVATFSKTQVIIKLMSTAIFLVQRQCIVFMIVMSMIYMVIS